MSSTTAVVVDSRRANFLRSGRCGTVAVAIMAAIAGAFLPVDGGAIAAEPQSPFAMSRLDATDKALLAVPIYAVIHDVLPDTYNALRAAVADGYRQRKTDAEINAILQSHVEPLVAKYLPVASDDAVVEMVHVMVLELEQISAKSAEACRSFAFPTAGQPLVDVTRYVSPELLSREATADAAVIKSGVMDPRPALSHDDFIEAKGLLGEIIRNNYSEAEFEALKHARTADPVLVCRIFVGIYKDTLALPPADQAPLLRFVFGLGAQK